MHLFFVPDLSGDSYSFSPEESKHCVRVLRLTIGSRVQLTDGKGKMSIAEITNDHVKHCTVQVLEEKMVPDEKGFHVHIAIAPTKNMARFEWFVEKVTEIGIDRITPIVCEHSERITLNQGRLTRIIHGAAKQSRKYLFPLIDPETTFDRFLSSVQADAKFIAYCGEERKSSLKAACPKGLNTVILIGPEGDFTTEEVALAREKKFTPVTLGNSRLRTETAGVIACHTVHLINE